MKIGVEYVDKKVSDTIGFSIFGCVTEPIGWDVHYAVYDYVEKKVWEEVGISVYNPLRSIVMKHISKPDKKVK